ncbi:MAG: glutamate-5-semialdehyde dehydrogenase [Gemmataceae bacterium]
MSEQLAKVCEDQARASKVASRVLALSSELTKNTFLTAAADLLLAHRDDIEAANRRDLTAAADLQLTAAQIERLNFTPKRIDAMAAGVRAIAELQDPIGLILDSQIRPNGLKVEKVSVPLGVILFLYESRPNVTADAAALAVKSGNAIILRGGKEAQHSNRALHAILVEALRSAGLPVDAVQFVESTDREVVGHLLKLSRYIDLVIPRGGESLIERVTREATMPVMKHYRGNCHVYVDRDADLEMARRIIVNAKCSRPGVCNAAESLIVHRDIAAQFLPQTAAELHKRGVEIRGCEEARAIVSTIKPATDEDYAAEYLDLILSVKVVTDLAGAIAHIARFGSGHTESIVTKSTEAARRFTAEVDAAAVMVNISTRFHDGGEFGLGAEIGISTDKFHARGPCGLRELTSYKYVVHGNGQIRE